MSKTPASIVLIIYTFISVWFVGGLTVFHLYLIGTNQVLLGSLNLTPSFSYSKSQTYPHALVLYHVDGLPISGIGVQPLLTFESSVCLQSTYENFRYRYDQRVNPFNKGVLHNFLEIFCTSIPPSKNNFRAKVAREPGIPPREVGGGFVSPNLEKTMSDLERGRKPSWHEQGTGANEFEGQTRHDNQLDKDEELSGATLPDGRSILHPRRSSWGRRSGTLEIPPDVVAMASEIGDSNRITVSSGAFSAENQQ